MTHPLLFEHINIFEKKLELSGLPQIDYVIQKKILNDPYKKLDRALIFKK